MFIDFFPSLLLMIFFAKLSAAVVTLVIGAPVGRSVSLVDCDDFVKVLRTFGKRFDFVWV